MSKVCANHFNSTLACNKQIGQAAKRTSFIEKCMSTISLFHPHMNDKNKARLQLKEDGK
jgi:hypothetical protein